MKKIALSCMCAAALAAGGAFAQEKLRINPGEGMVFTPRYQPAANPAEGHCILKVWVDDRATVLLRGDQIGVRTLSGTTARDEGSFCSGPLPIHVENFRIESSNHPNGGRVVDLTAPDRRNGYTGSVTIDDPRNGGRSYVLDVWWTDPRYTHTPPPVMAAYDEEAACQAEVREQMRSRNRGPLEVDFRSNVRREDMGSGREKIRGSGSAQHRDDTARFGYECVVNDRQNRVLSANYAFRGNDDRFR